ncbi:phage tail tube protein [Embleya hyalina]|uniref:Uncharacterized protein n=1 Tax=Embleya hyalina TaxID=516124 RepID=A0A401YHH4_9ACTN|nr:hypothetical protein [Embleya hyalina]GCD94076.1 hypothetical protein EHYA_01732 [Embleya hyalina]
MSQRPIDARGWVYQVESVPDTWLDITHVNSFTYNPGENEETAETTWFGSDGYYEEDVMQRGASLSLEGQHATDSVTGAQDPGQAYIDNVWALGLGVASHNRFRFRHETQTSWVVWDATMSPGEKGGGNNDKSSWSVTIRRSGAPMTMVVA